MQKSEQQVRIICSKCGKLLFKLENRGPEHPRPEPVYIIEIKCYNHACKTINVIKI